MSAYRVLPALVAMLAFLFLSALYVSGGTQWYSWILTHWGVAAFSFPFVDLHALFASWECKRLGIDVLAQNPCDVLARPFDYSPLLLVASSIPLGVGATDIVGWVLDFLFFASLLLLPPVRTRWELLIVVLASLSTMVAFAAERANLDLIVFMVALGVGSLVLRPSWERLLAYPIILLAAIGVKYYPISLMIVSVRERLSAFVLIGAAAACAGGLFVATYFSEVERGWPRTTATQYDDLFGAKNLPLGVADQVEDFLDVSPSSSPTHAYLIHRVALAILLLMGGALSWCVLKSADFRIAFAGLARHQSIFLVMGSAVIVGCFFAAQNTNYRGIFLLLVIPGLLAVARTARRRPLRMLGVGIVLLIVFLMWADCIRWNLVGDQLPIPGETGALKPNLGFWFFRECAWWLVVTALATVLIEFARGSQAWRSLMPGRQADPGAGHAPL